MPDRGIAQAPPPRREFGNVRTARSHRLLLHWTPDRPDGEQVIGLDRHHLGNVERFDDDAGHPGAVHDVFDSLPAADNRQPTQLTRSYNLREVEVPIEDAAHVIWIKTLERPIRQAVVYEFGSLRNEVLGRIGNDRPERSLPDEPRHDDKEHCEEYGAESNRSHVPIVPVHRRQAR